MKIAIIGAGFTGLTAAYELLKKGHEITIYEKATLPGGLALGFQEKEWKWTLEEYYHHWFTNDKAILDIAKEINYPVIIKRPKTSSYIDGKIYQLDSPLTLLNFSKLSLLDRLRMAAILAILRFDPFWKPLEKTTAADFLPKAMGQKAYQTLWEPLLINKFGKYTPEISLAWFWARIKKRTTSLAYPQGGFLKFAESLAQKVQQNGGKIQFNTNIQQINPAADNKIAIITDQDTVEIKNQKAKVFDKCIVTLPSFALTRLIPSLPDQYKQSLTSFKGIGAVVLVLRLKDKFLSDNTYWLNICNKHAPVLAIVEHTNFMDKKYYNNEHLLYLGNYLPQDHRYFSMDKKQLLKEFDPLLQKINPDYQKTIIGSELFKVPFAQPIIPINYSKKILPFQTPIKNLYLANMQQVYPWDRGTNYAVELGQKIAREVTY